MNNSFVTIHDRPHGLFGFASHPAAAAHVIAHLGGTLDGELGNIVARAEAVNRRAHAYTLARARVALSALDDVAIAFFKVLVVDHLVRRLYYHPHDDFALLVCRDGICDVVSDDDDEDVIALDMDPADRIALVYQGGWDGLRVPEQRRLLLESPDDAIATEWIQQAMGASHPRAFVFDVPSWNAPRANSSRPAASTVLHTERWQHELQELDKDLHDLHRRFKNYKQQCGPSTSAGGLEHQIQQVHREILRREWWVAHEAGDHRTMAIKQRAFEAL